MAAGVTSMAATSPTPTVCRPTTMVSASRISMREAQRLRPLAQHVREHRVERGQLELLEEERAASDDHDGEDAR